MLIVKWCEAEETEWIPLLGDDLIRHLDGKFFGLPVPNGIYAVKLLGIMEWQSGKWPLRKAGSCFCK